MTSGTAPRPRVAVVRPNPLPWTPLQPAPRASEQAFAGFGSLCFKAFLACQFLSLTRAFFIEHMGDAVGTLAGMAGIYSVVLLLPAVAAYGMRQGSVLGTLGPGARFWSLAVLFHSSLLLVYGLLRGHDPIVAGKEAEPYLVIVAAVILGSMPRIWKDTDRFVLVLYALALVINIVGMTEMTDVVSEVNAESREARSILAYRTQWALAFTPFLFFTSRLRKPSTALLIFAGVFFSLAQQILFQKRAPTVRVLLYIVVFVLVLPRLRPRRLAGGEARIQTLFATVCAIGIFISLSAAPWLFRGQLSGLTRRLSGDSYSGGATAMLTTENERFIEAGMFFRSLGPAEVVFGRGFGGWFVPDRLDHFGWIDEINSYGVRWLHVGGLIPFFKGGLLFAFLYYSIYFPALLRGWRLRADPFAAAAFFVLVFHVLFLFQESWFHMSTSLDLVLVGLCLGYVLSRDTARHAPAPAPPPWAAQVVRR
jgi:hypothetical protein